MPNGALDVARRQRGPAPPGGGGRPDPGPARGAARRSSASSASRQPDVVGLSVMTFQRATALRSSRSVRALRPGARIVVGGYDPSLAPEAYAGPDSGVDFVVRGEGELTFRELLRALEAAGDVPGIAGLSYREGDGLPPQPRPAGAAAWTTARSGRRTAPRACWAATRCWAARWTSIETSRGCTFDCSFCSIIEMRGRNFHTLRLRARARRHPRRRRSRRARDLPRRRQHHARRAPLRGALPGHRRGRARRPRLHRAGDDLGDRQPRRHAGARSCAGPASATSSSASRTSSTTTCGFLRAARQERPRARTAGTAATPPGGHRAPAPPRHVRGGRADRRQPGDTREAIEANLDVRAPLRGLAVHPAPHAVPAHADDRELRASAGSSSTSGWRSTTAPPPWCAASTCRAEEIEFMRWRPSAG